MNDNSRGFGKYKLPQYLMFGVTEEVVKYDEYGEILDGTIFSQVRSGYREGEMGGAICARFFRGSPSLIFVYTLNYSHS